MSYSGPSPPATISADQAKAIANAFFTDIHAYANTHKLEFDEWKRKNAINTEPPYRAASNKPEDDFYGKEAAQHYY